MTQVQEEQVIDLREVALVFKKRWPVLLGLPAAAVLISALLSFFVLTPIYRASTTLMVSKTYQGENGPVMQYNDILMANQLVKTYSEIAKSRAVLEKVIEQEKLTLTPDDLSKQITVKPLRDTQLIQISVENPDPQQAARLANAVAAVFMVKVVEVMKLDNVNVVDSAVVPEVPVKPQKLLNMVIAGVVGLMVAVGLVFLLAYLDQTIKSSEDVQRYLELPVLGTIPYMEEGTD
ncbi:MAG: YveK family protein [Bacillota bacterium]